MSIVPEITTERLLLKPLQSEDALQIQQVFPRWEIVRYLVNTVPWPYPEGAARYYIDNVALPAVQEGRGWFWSLRHQQDPQQLIGVINLMKVQDNNRGFWLLPEWQGQGLMTEACTAVNDFWFETLNQSVLRAPKAAINQRSKNLSSRNGMRLIRTEKAHYVAGELETELWEITREEWQQRNKK